MSPHGKEKDGGVPTVAFGSLHGGERVDRVEERLLVPEDGKRVGLGAGDSFGNGLPFIGGSLEVSSFDSGVADVGGGEVIAQKNRVKESP